MIASLTLNIIELSHSIRVRGLKSKGHAAS